MNDGDNWTSHLQLLIGSFPHSIRNYNFGSTTAKKRNLILLTLGNTATTIATKNHILDRKNITHKLHNDQQNSKSTSKSTHCAINSPSCVLHATVHQHFHKQIARQKIDGSSAIPHVTISTRKEKQRLGLSELSGEAGRAPPGRTGPRR
uniref:Pco068646 n=1 Tax=Arundo donax TaxID=35708 RepID=A0A0A9H5A5_ARUDO